MRVRVAVTINVPPSALWACLESIEEHVRWMADARRITFLTEQRSGVGTEFDCLTQVGPFRTTDRMVVTEWAPCDAMGIEHRGLITGRGRFTLRARRGGRTRFVWQEHLRFPWWLGGPVGAFVAQPVLWAVWRRNLRALKRLAEAAGESRAGWAT